MSDATVADGQPQPLPADARLFRRIRPDQIIDDENLGIRRPSSANFKDPEMSVDIELILIERGLDFQFCIKDHAGFSVAAVTTGAVQTLGLQLHQNPIAGVNPAHAEVLGKKTQGIANSLVAASSWVHLEPKS